MRLLAVDPGIRHCGVAIFEDGKLINCALVRNTVKEGSNLAAAACMAAEIVSFAARSGGVPADIAIEYPVIYATRIRQGKSKGDPNDLLTLAAVAGALAICAALAVKTGVKMHQYAPSAWKGQIPKTPKIEDYAIKHRVDKRVGSDRVMVSAPRSLVHNVYDAAGVGFHHIENGQP